MTTPNVPEGPFPALDELNRHAAGIFGRPVIAIRFVFLSHIKSKRRDEEVLGLCVTSASGVEVQLKLRPGWQNTAVHELVHAYNPGVSEARTKEIAKDLVKFLKIRWG